MKLTADINPSDRATLVWFNDDLRLEDHPALCAAAQRGPVIPVFIWALKIDLLTGGVGMRRGRRHPVDLQVGDI